MGDENTHLFLQIKKINQLFAAKVKMYQDKSFFLSTHTWPILPEAISYNCAISENTDTKQLRGTTPPSPVHPFPFRDKTYTNTHTMPGNRAQMPGAQSHTITWCVREVEGECLMSSGCRVGDGKHCLLQRPLVTSNSNDDEQSEQN